MNEEQESASVVQLWGQLFMMPVAAFVQGVKLFFRTMKAMQVAGDQGMKAATGSTFSTGPPELPTAPAEQQPRSGSAVSGGERGPSGTDNSTRKVQEGKMPDTNLHDDNLKLVRYKILFVKRGYECAFDEQEDLVADNMDGAAFTAWKIAEFIQDLANMDTKVPAKWKNYPEPEYVFNGKYLTGFDPDDKKYLRVYFEVLERYPREKFKFEEQQIDALKDISDNVKRISAAMSPAAPPPPAVTVSAAAAPEKADKAAAKP